MDLSCVDTCANSSNFDHIEASSSLWDVLIVPVRAFFLRRKICHCTQQIYAYFVTFKTDFMQHCDCPVCALKLASREPSTPKKSNIKARQWICKHSPVKIEPVPSTYSDAQWNFAVTDLDIGFSQETLTDTSRISRPTYQVNRTTNTIQQVEGWKHADPIRTSFTLCSHGLFLKS